MAKRNLTYIHVETVYVDVFCTNIDQTLVNPLHRMLNCGISGVDCMSLQQSIEHASIIYTRITYCVMH